MSAGHAQIAAPAQTVDHRSRPRRVLRELSTKTVEGNVWQNHARRFRATLPIALQPSHQQDSKLDDVSREWSAPELGIDKHYAYAFQWFVMAAAIVIIYIACNVRKNA